MTDANGIPLCLAAAGAKVLDIGLLCQTREDIWECSPQFKDGLEEPLALNNGYDSKAVRQMLETVFRYMAHIKSRRDESRDAKRSRRKKPVAGLSSEFMAGSIAPGEYYFARKRNFKITSHARIWQVPILHMPGQGLSDRF